MGFFKEPYQSSPGKNILHGTQEDKKRVFKIVYIPYLKRLKKTSKVDFWYFAE